jgi:hypothetical protein
MLAKAVGLRLLCLLVKFAESLPAVGQRWVKLGTRIIRMWFSAKLGDDAGWAGGLMFAVPV